MRAFYRTLQKNFPVTHDAWYVVVGMVIAAVMVLFLLAFVTIAQQDEIKNTIREIRTETEIRYEQDEVTQRLLCQLIKEQREDLSSRLLAQAEALPNCQIFSPAPVDNVIREVESPDNVDTTTPDTNSPRITNPKPNTSTPDPSTPGPTPTNPGPTVTNPTPTNPGPTNPTPTQPTPVKPGPVVDGGAGGGIVIDPTPLVDPIIETVDPIVSPIVDPIQPIVPTAATPQVDACAEVSGLQPLGTVCVSVGSIPLL